MRIALALLILALPAMAGREFVAASSQLGVCTIDPISPPFTMATWAWPRQTTTSVTLMAINTTTNATERAQINHLMADAGDPAHVAVNNAAGTGSVSTGAASVVTNRWQHFAGVFASATSRTSYVDGTTNGTDTTSITINGLNQVVLGCRKSTTYGVFYTGAMAQTAVWNVALSSDEILSLSAGASPLLIRPANLVFYAPLVGRETASEVNLVGAAISLTNSPSASADHPRIYRP